MAPVAELNSEVATSVPGADSKAAVRPEPVAQEIAVNATGTRPADGTGKRELFSEETNTVLISPDGAVIRLSAAVAAGQLIFLTNKNTKVEVVCQVLGQRSRPTGSYVELQFTEKIADFWGVAFTQLPAERAILTPAAAKKAEQAQETEHAVVEEPKKPTPSEAEKLQKEMEVLRQQLLQSTQQETGKKIAPIPVVSTAGIVAALFGTESAAAAVVPEKSVPTPLRDESTQGVAIPWPKEMGIADALKSETEPARSGSSQVAVDIPVPEKATPEKSKKAEPSLASPKSLSEDDILSEILPKPALDFSQAPEVAQASRKPAPAWLGKSALGMLSAVLLVVSGFGAWKLGFLSTSSSAGKSASAAKPVTTAKLSTKMDGAPKAAGTASGVTAEDANTQAAVLAPDGAKKIARSNDLLEVPENSVSRTDAPQKESAFKKSVVAEQGSDSAAEGSVIAADGALVAAKLLKAATPVYPPDAMRSFITGDVTLNAVVDAKGNVGKMEVIAGPAALRDAALDALQHYKYAAATRDGKGVSSEVQVVIKFWFDP